MASGLGKKRKQIQGTQKRINKIVEFELDESKEVGIKAKEVEEGKT